MRKIAPIDVLETIFYTILKEEDIDKFSSDPYYIQRVIFYLTREVPELKEFFPFRVAIKYSAKLDDALFTLNLARILETDSTMRYYQIRSEKLEQIREMIENQLPEELVKSIKEGIEKIRGTDEYKHLVYQTGYK